MNKIDLSHFFVGLDNLTSSPMFAQQTPEYPRYNIEKSPDGYIIHVAVPGWKQEQISVSVHNHLLSIIGKKEDCDVVKEWIHKGISGKSFEKHLKLDTTLVVASAHMDSGMLVINLMYSPSSKPQQINIT